MLVLGSLLFSSVMGVVATVAWVANRPAPVDLSPAVPQARAVAEAVAQDFLAGRPLAVPLAAELSQYGAGAARSPFAYQSVTWQSFNRGGFFTGQVLETHQFLVTYPSVDEFNAPIFRRMTMSVIIVVTDPETGSAPYLAALPTLTPDNSVIATGKALYYDASLSVSMPTPATEAVTDWARAYAGNDRKRLQEIAGDPETGFEYRGLGGFTVENVSVLASVPIDQAQTQFLVQARVTLTAPGDYRQEMDMELTVVAATTASPKVQGWGPIGVGVVAPGANRVPL